VRGCEKWKTGKGLMIILGIWLREWETNLIRNRRKKYLITVAHFLDAIPTTAPWTQTAKAAGRR